MAEQTFNINFVRVVRKHPCVYDNTMREYTLRPVVEAAWHSIAKQIGEDVKSCKERWKNIRTVFRREVVLWKGSSKKPYYLNDEMQFMLPFLSRRGRVIQIKKDSYDFSNLGDAYDNSFRDEAEDNEGHTKMPTEDPLNIVETVTHELSEDKRFFNEPIRIKEERIDEPGTPEFLHPETPSDQDQSVSSLAEKDRINHQQYKSTESPPPKKLRAECYCLSDPDQQFLLSLKPDLEQMNMEQKRRFKRGIFSLLADIMDNDHRSQPSPSPSSSYR
ncbi:uncharacterized protein [Halyomorpha halys]|uniref:uncharacterized protein n=1 Tax=Halyomorpha halys TaxID=286706 RepID=UPI0006D52825|nr:uncharacterized protein LOC106686462 [Halyomorpha halys]